MDELKKARKKHDHKGTKILKIIIFSLVMLAPFLSVLSRCLYTLNPNAKDSYYGHTINDSSVINVGNELVVGQFYKLNGGLISYEYQSEVILYVANASCSFTSYEFNEIHIRSQSNATYCLLYNNGNYVTDRNYSVSSIFEITFTFLRKNNNDLISSYQTITQTLYNNYSFLDNAFEYSINNLKQNNLYNWAEQTGIYTAVKGMTDGLGANDVIALLIAYWAILIAIYIVFDIVIELFTKITHFINADD